MTTTTDTRPSGALGFYVAAVLGLAVSLDTSWRFFGERLDITGAERIVMFTVLEVALIACGWAMRANVQRYGAPGSPRVLAWGLLALSGYIAWDLSGPVQGLARVGLGPLLALVMLHAALGIEIRHRSGQSGATLARIGRELRERGLSRLGLADDERDALTRTRERAARRAAKLAVHPRSVGRNARLTRALRAARIGTDADTRAVMLAELAVLQHGRDLASLDLPAPWATDRDRMATNPTDPTDRERETTATATAPADRDRDRMATATTAPEETAIMSVTSDNGHADRADRMATATATAATGRDQVAHRRAVKAAESTADAVVYAVDATGYDRPSEIARWLTGHGRETTPEAVRSALRRARGRSSRAGRSTDDDADRDRAAGERAA